MDSIKGKTLNNQNEALKLKSDTDELEKEFFEAVNSNNIPKVIELVKEKGVDVNETRYRSCYCETALHKAADRSYEDLIHVLVEQLGAFVDIQDDLGDLPIHRTSCTRNMNLKLTKYFKDQGSDCESVLEYFKIKDENALKFLLS